MIIISKKLLINKECLDVINKYLHTEPKDESECLGEDETISYTVKFPDGIEMDIKCCGVQYSENETSNKAWAEAVLFQNDAEIGHTDVEDEFEGQWILEDSENDKRYIVEVESNGNQKTEIVDVSYEIQHKLKSVQS